MCPSSNLSDKPTSLRIKDEVEACACILFACRRADEIDGPGGNQAFLYTLKTRNIFIGQDVDQLVEKSGAYFQQAGSWLALIDASVGAIREQTRLPLFYHCLDVLLADGVVTPQENKVFQYLKNRLHVDDETAFEALDILVVKNKL